MAERGFEVLGMIVGAQSKCYNECYIGDWMLQEALVQEKTVNIVII